MCLSKTHCCLKIGSRNNPFLSCNWLMCQTCDYDWFTQVFHYKVVTGEYPLCNLTVDRVVEK